MFRFIITIILIINSLYGDDIYKLSNFVEKEFLTSYQNFYIDDKAILTPYDINKSKLSKHKNGIFGRIGKNAITSITIFNDTQKDHNLILQHPRAGTDKIKIWILDDNRIIKDYTLGDRFDIEDRELHSIKSSIKLAMKPNQKIEIVANFASFGVLEANLVLLSQKNYDNSLKYSSVWWGVFVGIMLTLILFNFINYFIEKNKSYIIHMIYATATLISYISIYGVLYYFDIISNFLLIDTLGYICPALGVGFHILFPIYFFDLKNHNKKLYYLLKYFAIIVILQGIFYIFTLFNEALFLYSKYLSIFILIAVVLILIISFYSFSKKMLGSGYYLLSQIFITSSYLYNMIIIDGFSRNIYIEAAIITSLLSLLEIIFINLAISKKIKLIVDERNLLHNVANLYENYIYVGKHTSDIIHQWKTPLSNLSSLVAMLKTLLEFKNDIPKDIMIDSISDLEDISNTLRNISDDIYDYMSNSTTKRESNIEDSIKETIKYLGKDKNVIKFIYKNTDRNIIIVKSALNQVLLNLLSNSIKNFDNKNIKDRIIIFEVFENENNIILTIEDNGEGVKIDKICKLLTPYISCSNSLGTGFFVVKKLVNEKLNGDLKIINSKTGLKVEILLPKLINKTE